MHQKPLRNGDNQNRQRRPQSLIIPAVQHVFSGQPDGQHPFAFVEVKKYSHTFNAINRRSISLDLCGIACVFQQLREARVGGVQLRTVIRPHTGKLHRIVTVKDRHRPTLT